MLRGLDLFSGIGGLTLALAPWVRPIAYCENDRYAQSVLLSRMHDGMLHRAPIWDDVRSLRGDMLPGPVDVISAGFPCQDLSCAGLGAGLEGERSGLFFDVSRLAEEVKPALLFLENVPAIRTRGAQVVCESLAGLGFDCRWMVISAEDVGAPHRRSRWFLLAAHPDRLALRDDEQREPAGRTRDLPDSREAEPRDDGNQESLAHCGPIGRPLQRASHDDYRSQSSGDVLDQRRPAERRRWWFTEPSVGRVADGVPHRLHRIAGLGNAVVALQARQAFETLLRGR